MTPIGSLERRLLQISVALAGIVPVWVGVAGALGGSTVVGSTHSLDLDSHFRYLSGLLAAIGLLYWSTIPRIEVMSGRFALLTLIVVCGGFARALGMLFVGPPGGGMIFGLVMELVVTPALYLWQGRVARRMMMAQVVLKPVGAPGAEHRTARNNA